VKKLLLLIVFSIFIGFLPAKNLKAQCSVCRATVESANENGESNLAKGINNGVLYLMAIPYLLGIITAIIILKQKRQRIRKS